MQQLAEDLDTVVEMLLPTGPWAGRTGVVGLDVAHLDGGRRTRSLVFAADGVSLSDAAPDVSLRLPARLLGGLAAGTEDGALLYLSGGLEVDGDEDLLLAIGSQWCSAAGRPLIDAAALDPTAVSRAIADAPTLHLATVMAGGFRGLVLSEVFRRLPDFLIAEKAERVRVTVSFDILRSEIGGRGDGGVDQFVVRVRDGVCTVTAGAPDETVDATLVLEGHQFLRLVLGHLNPVRGVLSGDIAVRGQVFKALGFNAVMRIPGT